MVADSVIHLFLRRMRAPLLMLIAVYAFSIGGLVLIPGVDAAGRPWRFDFLHAFYFTSYTASTIGFGEIPHAFTPAQRLWVSFTIYLTVIGWLYAFGNILALLQDPAFRRALARQRFERRIKGMSTPFYIVCGYGETGALVVELLMRQRLGVVIVDIDTQVVASIDTDTAYGNLPALVADARDPAELLRAGVRRSNCLGVIAVTGNDDVNVDVTLATLLLNPRARIVCNAQGEVARTKLPSTHTAVVIDAFETFADWLALALHQPQTFQLYRLLSEQPGRDLPKVIAPPRGHWVLCGYGRFGHAVERALRDEGVSLSVIDLRAQRDLNDVVQGAGTDADTLRSAGIERAAGLVAGTDSDISNLGIVLNARELKPDVFTAARQNLDLNEPLFSAAPVDFVMETSRLVVRRIGVELTNPLLQLFFERAQDQSSDWATALIEALCRCAGQCTPEVWTIRITERHAPALVAALRRREICTLDMLLRDPREREAALPCSPLLLQDTEAQLRLLPRPEHRLSEGDAILFAGAPGASWRMEWTLQSPRVLEYARTGRDIPDGYVYRWWSRAATNGANRKT